MVWYWRGLWTCSVISSKQNVTDINVYDTITINSLIIRLNFSNAIFVYFTFFLFTVVVSSKRATVINTTNQDYR